MEEPKNPDEETVNAETVRKDRSKRNRKSKRKQAELQEATNDSDIRDRVETQQSKAQAELSRLQLQVSIANSEADFISAKEIGENVLNILVEDKSVPTHIAGHYFYLMSIIEVWLGNYSSARQHSNKAALLFESLTCKETSKFISLTRCE